MGPPGFCACFVCHREFGSKSLALHEPQCLTKWRRSNDELPKNIRQKTPSPPPNKRLLRPVKHVRLDSLSPTTSYESSSASSNGKGNQTPSSSMTRRRKQQRPSTAILDKPEVLDINLKHEIDMSQMSREMVEKLVLHKNQKCSSDYSSDFSSYTSSSSSSPDLKISGDDLSTEESEEESSKRPSTIRLKRASNNISVPVILSTNSRALPRRGKTATIKSNNMHIKKRQSLADEILGSKEQITLLEPCRTCGKDENPERFHTHPFHFSKLKSKEKKGKDFSLRTLNKLSISKSSTLKNKNNLSSTIESTPIKVVKNQNKSAFKSRKIHNNTHRKSKLKLTKRSSQVALSSSLNNKLKDISEQNSALEERKINIKENLKIKQNFNSAKTNSSSGQTNEYLTDKVPERIYTAPLRICLTDKVPERIYTAPLRICHICGREFGSRSLTIHEPQCLQKWRRENDQLPKHLRREEPKRPEKVTSREEWNKHAWTASQAQLLPCSNCGRTFQPDRLQVHQRGCRPPSGDPETVSESRETKSAKQLPRPTIVCYICGREFGSRSITIHEPQCLAKWRNENDKLPKKLQRPDPVKPQLLLQENGTIDTDAMAEAAWQSHLETLVKCEGCARTFFPDRLELHQKLCKNMNS